MESKDAGDYTAAARALAVRFAPASMLCIGPDGGRPEFCSTSLRFDPGQRLFERLSVLGRFDLALVWGTLEFLDRPEALAVLARLRDVHAPRVIAVLPRRAPADTRCRLDDNDLLALGFTLTAAEGGDARIAIYDLAEYKLTPDWLNARFWAHPERWDKDFW
jgi:hypothetical protein